MYIRNVDKLNNVVIDSFSILLFCAFCIFMTTLIGYN